MRFDNIQVPKGTLPKVYELQNSLRDSFNHPIHGKCMFRSGGCADSPIKSHLLARSWLQRIADESNHVLQLDLTINKIGQQPPEIKAIRVGINEATTFRGFCEKHDSSIFGCLETQPFTATLEQLTALRYRSICREAFGKHRKATALIPEFVNRRDPTPLGVLTVVDAIRCVGLMAEKAAMETALSSGDQDVASYVIQFDKTPTVLVSSTFYPLATFTGRPLDPRDETVTLRHNPKRHRGMGHFQLVQEKTEELLPLGQIVCKAASEFSNDCFDLLSIRGI